MMMKIKDLRTDTLSMPPCLELWTYDGMRKPAKPAFLYQQIGVMCTIRMLIYNGLSGAQRGKDEDGRMKDERA